MSESVIVSVGALLTAAAALLKQIYDSNQVKRWICTKNPCEGRMKGEPPPG